MSVSVCVSVCVCLSVILSPELHYDLHQFLRVLPKAVARFSSGGVAIRYVFPVF